MNTVNKYTWLGFSSILIWASLVAVVKLITEQVTPVSGIAMIYSFSALCILIFGSMPSLKEIPKEYLYGCGILFVSYEILFLISSTTNFFASTLADKISYLLFFLKNNQKMWKKPKRKFFTT